MDLRQIAYVEAVARNANFTRAAAEIHVAQPALSVAIRRLEAELGVRLFERTSRRVSLTPAGTAFLDRAARVSREVEALADEMSEYAGGIRGRLRLSAWYHVEPDLVDFMRDFTSTNPFVEVSIQELPAAETLAALRAGDVDLAAVVQFPGLNLDDFERAALRTEPAVLVVRADDVLAGEESLNLADLSDRPFVVTRPGTGLRRLFDHVFVGAEHPPRIAIETNELAAMVAFASAGLGSAILTPTVVREADFPVSLVRLADVGPFTTVAVWRKDENDPVVLSAIDMIQRHTARAGDKRQAQALRG
jgi:LysR family transcriptional regulator, transcription activator of glutamate synthase operon